MPLKKFKIRSVWLFLWVILCPLICPSLSYAEVDEFELKAAYLYHFSFFATWPQKKSNPDNTSFNICLLGKNPFGQSLLEKIKNKSVRDKPINIKEISSISEATSCHTLFVHTSENDYDQILGKAKSLPLLTVGEGETFCRHGGIISFVLINNKIHFLINQRAAALAGLKISSQLLSLAEIKSY